MSDLESRGVPATNVVPARPIHDALRESLAGLSIRFSATLPSFKRDRLQTAGGRERSVAELLESYLPPAWSVKKGPIYDNRGGVSNEVDAVVCVPQHPACRTPMRDVILAEGVHVAIEVKPDIGRLASGGEFARSLKQALSVKRLQRTITFAFNRTPPGWRSEAHRIPYIVFAEKIPALRKIADFMEAQKQQNGWSPWDLPDVIVGYRDGLVYHAPEAALCSLAPLFIRSGLPSGEGYFLFPTSSDTVILLVTILYSFATPQPQLTEPLLKEYLFPLDISPGMELLRVVSTASQTAREQTPKLNSDGIQHRGVRRKRYRN